MAVAGVIRIPVKFISFCRRGSISPASTRVQTDLPLIAFCEIDAESKMNTCPPSGLRLQVTCGSRRFFFVVSSLIRLYGDNSFARGGRKKVEREGRNKKTHLRAAGYFYPFAVITT